VTNVTHFKGQNALYLEFSVFKYMVMNLRAKGQQYLTSISLLGAKRSSIYQKICPKIWPDLNTRQKIPEKSELDVFRLPEFESELSLWPKIQVPQIINMWALTVRNCSVN